MIPLELRLYLLREPGFASSRQGMSRLKFSPEIIGAALLRCLVAPL